MTNNNEEVCKIIPHTMDALATAAAICNEVMSATTGNGNNDASKAAMTSTDTAAKVSMSAGTSTEMIDGNKKQVIAA